jgi:hypothetical protein
MTDNLLDNIQIEDPTNYLNELVGEGKKFKDLESLAQGKYQSDVYIKTLERQLDQIKSDYAEARNELSSRAKFAELADKLTANRQPSYEQPEPKNPEINLEQLETIVANKIKETETLRKQEENFKLVQSKLSEYFGANNVETKLKEVGLDGKSAAAIAKTAPELVLKALGVNQVPQQPGFQPPPKTTSGFNQQPKQERTWAYYQEMFKADPKLKYDSKTNVQMQKDYIELGAKFEDGDFHRFG